jgi:hypothetical protein
MGGWRVLRRTCRFEKTMNYRGFASRLEMRTARRTHMTGQLPAFAGLKIVSVPIFEG